MLRIALLIAALAAGGAAAWMAVSLRGGSAVVTVVEPAIPAPVQDVLVASADVALGHALAKEDMRWQSWPEGALNPAYITRSARPDALETLAGSVVHSRLISGEPIRDENLAPVNAGSLAAMLPSGKRAVAVAISAQNFAGGLIRQNDRVDVILTVIPTPNESKTATATEATSRTSMEGQAAVSYTILRNIPVLAIDVATDPTADERSKDEKSKAKVFVGRTATLELEPSQVEILARDEAMGRLSLALRSAADNGERPPLAQPQKPPPPTRLQSSQSFKHAKFGSIDVIELVKSEKLVEIPGPKEPSEPSRAPEQRMRGKPLQAQQNSSGVAFQ